MSTSLTFPIFEKSQMPKIVKSYITLVKLLSAIKHVFAIRCSLKLTRKFNVRFISLLIILSVIAFLKKLRDRSLGLLFKLSFSHTLPTFFTSHMKDATGKPYELTFG